MSMKTRTCLVVTFVCFILLLIYFSRDNIPNIGASTRIKMTVGWKDEVLKIMKSNPDVFNDEIEENQDTIVKNMQYCEEETEFYTSKEYLIELEDPYGGYNMIERRRVVFMLTPGANGRSCVVNSRVEVVN
eukprot:935201_1